MRIGGRDLAVVVSVLAVAGCGGTKIQVAPRLDLVPFQQLALVTFTIENAKGSLNQVATDRFAVEMLGAQSGFELLELGEQQHLLDATGATRFGPTEARMVGEEQGVPAVFFGHMIVSDVKPSASISGIPRVGVEVSVELTVRLLSTESGGTIWSASSRSTAVVGEVAFDGGIPSFGARDPADAYGDLVDALVWEVTRDMRPTYVRQ